MIVALIRWLIGLLFKEPKADLADKYDPNMVLMDLELVRAAVAETPAEKYQRELAQQARWN